MKLVDGKTRKEVKPEMCDGLTLDDSALLARTINKIKGKVLVNSEKPNSSSESGYHMNGKNLVNILKSEVRGHCDPTTVLLQRRVIMDGKLKDIGHSVSVQRYESETDSFYFLDAESDQRSISKMRMGPYCARVPNTNIWKMKSNDLATIVYAALLNH